MDKLFLAANVGSASKKFGLYKGAARLFSAHFEKEAGKYVVTLHSKNGEEKRTISEHEFVDAAEYVVSEITTLALVKSAHDITAVGFRVVAPGSYFREHRIIDTEYLHRLRKARNEDPLHLDAMFEELDRLKKLFKKSPIIGVSDSAFHARMPLYASTYALPETVRFGLDIARFGYHGLSIASIVRALGTSGAVPEKIIVCHLGSGSSITALKNGASVDTSMGFSPLEGVPMATRVGDIDAGALLHLARFTPGHSLTEVEKILYTESGLLGISGSSSDMRELIELERKGDARAQLAIDTYTYHSKKYIGAYVAVLGGIDLLVFSGTIGERSFIVRERICEGLEHLGISIDPERNNALDGDASGSIHTEHSRVQVSVILSDESEEIARITSSKERWAFLSKGPSANP